MGLLSLHDLDLRWVFCHRPYIGVTFVVVQTKWVHTFQGRGAWIRNVRQNRQSYKEIQRHRIVPGGQLSEN